MKIYNTLTRKTEEIKPTHPGTVSVYTCGPTVYDYPHIGNWFTFIRYDLLIRALVSAELTPNWVMNITDVGHLTSDADEGEDKLEKGARREGKSAWDVAKFYGDYFVEALDRLNITAPQRLPKATDHIQEQIDLVLKLEKKGHTYVIDDGVYYDTKTFPEYGKMARLNLEEQREGARVTVNKQKRNPTDFALWKFSPKNQTRDMEWDSPWGKGFPGWHLECSAMSMKYLGETIDIHAGGIDHIPVHHTNEIAQSEGATDVPFAKYWMHTNHILIDDQKIAKSLGNGITLEDIAAKGVDLQAVRMLVLESHYRSQAHFSWDTLEAASNRLGRWQAIASRRWQQLNDNPSSNIFKQANQAMLTAIQDDLNTPEALKAIDTAFAAIEAHGLSASDAQDFSHLLQNISQALGINLLDNDLSDDQKAILAERQSARDNKDWQKSDELRNQLTQQKIGVRDDTTGQIWYRL